VKDKTITVNNDSLTIQNISEEIMKTFSVNRKIKLFNNQGLEVQDDSDLYYLFRTVEKVIFFIRDKDVFENTNLLRLYNLEQKIGEV
jgi:hypothetical protein